MWKLHEIHISVSINKVLLAHSLPIHWSVVHGGFYAVVAEWIWLWWDHMDHKPLNMYRLAILEEHIIGTYIWYVL